MGASVKHSSFNDDDYQRFSNRLQDNLHTLAELLKQPEFGLGAPSLGAELELTLVDSRGQAKWLNQKMLDLAKDPQLTLELNQYNLEYNLSPVATVGSPFSTIAAEISSKLKTLDKLAQPFDARSVAIGILPTLTKKDVSSEAMTDFNRYRILTDAITKLRGSPFEINIDGADPLFMTLTNLNSEGANTSFQIHLRVNPDRFAATYNAAQMATATALAVSTNSPIFLQHRLWEETRVALFKQAVETRNTSEMKHHKTARTGLGSQWIQHSALELFTQSVNEFQVLLPECGDREDPANPPELFELRLHHGSIWHWNRAIYDPAAGGHLRIEMRALPGGPSVIDMAASAAFLVGLTQALSHRMQDYIQLINFDMVKGNFYRAAQHGMDAPLIWISSTNKLETLPAWRLVESLIPLARSGLEELEVDRQEIERFLPIIQERLERRITGARWQLRMLKQFEIDMNRESALQRMLECYLSNFDSGQPVHLWSIDS